MNEQQEIQELKQKITRLKDFIYVIIKTGNTMSIKTGVYPCAKHYQKELKDWADIVTQYEEENKQ